MQISSGHAPAFNPRRADETPYMPRELCLPRNASHPLSERTCAPSLRFTRFLGLHIFIRQVAQEPRSAAHILRTIRQRELSAIRCVCSCPRFLDILRILPWFRFPCRPRLVALAYDILRSLPWRFAASICTRRKPPNQALQPSHDRRHDLR